MGHAASNSGPRSAVSCIRKRSQKGWTALTGSSTLSPMILMLVIVTERLIPNRGMQDCFHDHPDVYGAELEDDDQEVQEEDAATPSDASSEPSQPTQPSPSPAPESGAGQTPTAPLTRSTSSRAASSSAPPPSHAHAEHPSPAEEKGRTERAKAATRQVKDEHEPQSESDEMVPKAMFDATASNEGK